MAGPELFVTTEFDSIIQFHSGADPPMDLIWAGFVYKAGAFVVARTSVGFKPITKFRVAKSLSLTPCCNAPKSIA